ncbi:hypothetical protein WJX73_003489 [Symbiochloris irregularis]|uniref:Uncharacterized protein n=1 Tax=Symbiochloris irregularis TaxID=706552 RepID=A0AAW1PF35_9CHLO
MLDAIDGTILLDAEYYQSMESTSLWWRMRLEAGSGTPESRTYALDLTRALFATDAIESIYAFIPGRDGDFASSSDDGEGLDAGVDEQNYIADFGTPNVVTEKSCSEESCEAEDVYPLIVDDEVSPGYSYNTPQEQ